MPLFQIENKKLRLAVPINFKLEKDIQALIEENLFSVFNCRFIASEFPTGLEHAGRIDTLALSEENNPVIIEYKKVESSELVNQSLYYLAWIQDHKGDFTVMAQRKLGSTVKIDWSDIRVICIAPGYKKFDIHAVKTMGANIELWQYKFFDNNSLYLEEISRRNLLNDSVIVGGNGKNPVMVAAGKKAALTRATGVYSFDEHFKKAEEKIRKLITDVREYIMNLDDTVEESPKKLYVAYKSTQNFVCMEIHKNKFFLFLKTDPKEKMSSNARDVSDIGHFGTGDVELTIRDENDLEEAYRLIKKSFDNVGG